MIIAFYPGGCGNRYLNFIKDKEYQTFSKSYEASNRQKNTNRYLLSKNTKRCEGEDTEIILTHCLNYNKIKYYFPKHSIVALVTDLKSSLRRQFMLDGIDPYNKNNKVYSILDIYNSIREYSWPRIEFENQIDKLPVDIKQKLEAAIVGYEYYSGPIFKEVVAAFETICFHRKYYETYQPTVYTVDETTQIDCNNPTDEFTRVVNMEIGLYKNTTFDFAWNIFEKYGPQAPIINEWENYIGLKNFNGL